MDVTGRKDEDWCIRYETVAEGLVKELGLLVAPFLPVGPVRLTRIVFATETVMSVPGKEVLEILSLAGIEEVWLAENDIIVYFSLFEADGLPLLSLSVLYDVVDLSLSDIEALDLSPFLGVEDAETLSLAVVLDVKSLFEVVIVESVAVIVLSLAGSVVEVTSCGGLLLDLSLMDDLSLVAMLDVEGS